MYVHSFSCIVLASLLVVGCQGGTTEFTVNANMAEQALLHKVRIGVLPFTEYVYNDHKTCHGFGWSASSVSDNGRIVADELARQLMNVKGFLIVERSQLQAILEEHNLAISDITEQQSLSEIGHLLNLDYLVLGKVNRYDGWVNMLGMNGGEVSFNARMVEVDNGLLV